MERESSILLRARRRLLSLEDIPTCPESEQTILSLVARDDVSLDDLAAAIDRNPGLAANVVGLANSAYYATGKEVFTARDAIIRVLGLRTVKSLTLGLLLSGSFEVHRCPNFDVGAYWTRALGTAILAQRLAQAAGTADPDEAYLCGLLHDFGLLLLVHTYPEEMDALLATPAMDTALARARQVRSIGLDAGRAGAMLSLRWSLPPSVGLVAEHHWDASWRGDAATLSLLVGTAAMRIADLQQDPQHGDVEALAARCGELADAVRPQLQAINQEIANVASLSRTLERS